MTWQEPEMPFIQIQKGFPWEAKSYRIPQMVDLYGDGSPSDHPCPEQWDNGSSSKMKNTQETSSNEQPKNDNSMTEKNQDPMTGTVEDSDLVSYEFKVSAKWLIEVPQEQKHQFYSLTAELWMTPCTSIIAPEFHGVAVILRGKTTRELMTKVAMFIQTMWDTVGGYPEDV